MARDDGYVKTGRGWLGSVANWASFIPFVGSGITFVAGAVDTLVETGQWLLRGKLLSAGTALASGSVSTVVNTAVHGNPIFWGANVAQGLFTGRSLGTHARALTENVVGGAAGMLGQKPTVLRSYPAGIGSIGGAGAGQQQSQPGYWSSRVAQEQGQDPQRRWQQYVDESRQGAMAAGRA